MVQLPAYRDRRGILFIVCGPSGVGKSSLCHHLLDHYPRTRFSVSYTTRAPRGSERNGEDYHFVDRSAFEGMIGECRFAEWAQVHGNFYGTSRQSVQGALDDGLDILFDIDYQGARQLREAFEHTASVMVAPPSWSELERRLRGRQTDSEEVILRRLDKAREELSHFEAFDYVIINDDLSRAQSRMRSIYQAAEVRTVVQLPRIKGMLES